ncbi:Transcription elongation factor 1 [Wallemia ichthyophaga EXF-994]|uniref:Transcription elongation factor 1 homolog n=1 Tax=Wallemia ichthyophaga (strain EXF-994 / CBS 113033) TaxID=1299270 RepID=R9AK57_WALI9|nr:Transcription elongation factor 1 [Wallemia ichthyophaga EXF-994]EOR00431.1 Transcription elongation factor 1 [Wallemia ichthyophaga EXF-994]
MGKRKAARKPTGPKKDKTTLPKTFECLFCSRNDAVQVKLDQKNGMGYLNCKVCNMRFESTINSLTAPVDLYHDWIDANDEVNFPQQKKKRVEDRPPASDEED